MALSGPVLCTVTVEEAEQVIIGKERNIGDGRCPELGAGAGAGQQCLLVTLLLCSHNL